jgi:transcriptional regulator with XRE-family HTH domain
MTLGNRISLFINSCYKSQSQFAELVQLDPSSLNRYIHNKCTPTIDILEKFKKLGMSIDWLIDGQGSMFAQNEVGGKLKINNRLTNNSPDEINKSNKFINRIKTWIYDNYGNLENLCHTFQAEFEDLSNVIFLHSIPDTSFYSIIEEAGCNFNWIITGDGDCYNDTFTGMILRLKRDGVKDFNHTLQDSTISLKQLNDAKTTNDLLALIRKAIRLELKRNKKNEV